ncbi:LPS assembly lipoprotein LptE [Edaphobacter flagellatus]|uniref:LPS assembly lipoprotein LptE n=1 Tax=Edaphobacter flagellatus TaxID=1933044 RepID=UPI0021B2463F|nr:LPS assembly lipoprotein LptE [Edaphobacter flagellatus]
MNLRAVILLALTTFLAGCGYHTAGSATHIPANVRTLSVPIFATNVQAYRTEVAFTQAIVRELNTRTKYRIVSNDSADTDATLNGTILSETITPLTYDATSGQTSSYLVSVTARVILTARDGHVLYRNSAITFREQYQSTQDLSGFIQEGSPAINRMSKDFALAVVSDMLESF